jgi:hypothetical protein
MSGLVSNRQTNKTEGAEPTAFLLAAGVGIKGLRGSSVETVRYFLLVFIMMAGNALACPFASEITKEAEKAQLPPEIVLSIAKAESSCNPKAVGGGARGLFQFEEATWLRYGTGPFSNAFDPHLNIKAAIKYLSKADKSDVRNLISWHNAGVKDWRRLNPKWSINHPNRIYREIYRGLGGPKT